MTTASYSDATRSVLDRLQGVGYEFGPSHVNHAPMAAEAMVWLGYADEVPDWVQTNIERRGCRPPPRSPGSQVELAIRSKRSAPAGGAPCPRTKVSVRNLTLLLDVLLDSPAK
jgi:hypothetical protein